MSKKLKRDVDDVRHTEEFLFSTDQIALLLGLIQKELFFLRKWHTYFKGIPTVYDDDDEKDRIDYTTHNTDAYKKALTVLEEYMENGLIQSRDCVPFFREEAKKPPPPPHQITCQVGDVIFYDDTIKPPKSGGSEREKLGDGYYKV